MTEGRRGQGGGDHGMEEILLAGEVLRCLLLVLDQCSQVTVNQIACDSRNQAALTLFVRAVEMAADG